MSGSPPAVPEVRAVTAGVRARSPDACSRGAGATAPWDSPGFEWEPGGSGAACGPGRPSERGRGHSGAPTAAGSCVGSGPGSAAPAPGARRLRAAGPALPRLAQVVEGGGREGWGRDNREGAALPQEGDQDCVGGRGWGVHGHLCHPTILCIIMCARRCVFLAMFWNPKEVIAHIAEELGGMMGPVWTGWWGGGWGVGAWISGEVGKGLLAPRS